MKGILNYLNDEDKDISTVQLDIFSQCISQCLDNLFKKLTNITNLSNLS